MRRVAFLYDGFNLYHSLCLAERASAGVGLRWLDLVSLSKSLLPRVGGGAELASVSYFSAFANHVEAVKPGAVARHRDYVDALRATGVDVRLGRFKQRIASCPMCGAQIERIEEKESDVGMAIRLLELIWGGECDVLVLVSADSDLTPAVRAVRQRFPWAPVFVCFPYGRGTHELHALAHKLFRLRRESYAAHQLPDPLVTPSGRVIRKPAGW